MSIYMKHDVLFQNCANQFPKVILDLCFNFLISRQRRRNEQIGIFLSVGFLSKWLQQSGLHPAEARSSELNLGLPHGWPGRRFLSLHYCCLWGCSLAGRWGLIQKWELNVDIITWLVVIHTYMACHHTYNTVSYMLYQTPATVNFHCKR